MNRAEIEHTPPLRAVVDRLHVTLFPGVGWIDIRDDQRRLPVIVWRFGLGGERRYLGKQHSVDDFVRDTIDDVCISRVGDKQVPAYEIFQIGNG